MEPLFLRTRRLERLGRLQKDHAPALTRGVKHGKDLFSGGCYVENYPMRTLCVITMALAAGAIRLQAQNSKRLDVENLFPNVAGGVTLVDPNDAGIPPGV